MKITLDIGEDVSLLKHFDQDIIDKTSKVTTFVSRIDALNYLSLLGWDVVHQLPFETDSDGGTYQTIRYLMKRIA